VVSGSRSGDVQVFGDFTEESLILGQFVHDPPPGAVLECFSIGQHLNSVNCLHKEVYKAFRFDQIRLVNFK
jgi:hypothetical protein